MSAYTFKGFILIVDNEESTLGPLEGQLKDWGHKVHATDNVKHAIKCIHRHNYDVALIDLHFVGEANGPNPEKAGLLVLKEAVRKPLIEAIIMTAYESVPTAIEALREGAFDYVVKGATFLDRIGDAVERALATRQVHWALAEALAKIEESMRFINSAGLKGRHIDDATNAVQTAGAAYLRLLKTRGRKPDPTSADSDPTHLISGK
jgi:two-component system response regulator HydG